MIRLFPILVAFPLVIGFGIAEGMWSDRWGNRELAQAAADRLAALPANVGDWESQSEELDPRQAVKAELNGSLLRHYSHKQTGALLTVMLVCGRPGPVSVHTPDVCFVGSGYTMTETPMPHSVAEARPAQFLVSKFRRGDEVISSYYRVFWGWTADGNWSAPNSPRLAFARDPALYKLYIVRPMSRADERLSDDPALEFLRLLLPQIRDVVFAGGADVKRPATGAK